MLDREGNCGSRKSTSDEADSDTDTGGEIYGKIKRRSSLTSTSTSNSSNDDIRYIIYNRSSSFDCSHLSGVTTVGVFTEDLAILYARYPS